MWLHAWSPVFSGSQGGPVQGQLELTLALLHHLTLDLVVKLKFSLNLQEQTAGLLRRPLSQEPRLRVHHGEKNEA